MVRQRIGKLGGRLIGKVVDAEAQVEKALIQELESAFREIGIEARIGHREADVGALRTDELQIVDGAAGHLGRRLPPRHVLAEQVREPATERVVHAALATCEHVDELLLGRREEAFGLPIRLRDRCHGADHHIGLLQRSRGLEPLAVDLDRVEKLIRRKMRRKRVR